MKTPLLSTVSLTLLTPLTAPDLGFRASEGLSLHVSIEESAELALTDEEVTITVDGEEQETGERPDIELTMTLTEGTSFVDTYARVEDGSAGVVRRRFESIRGEWAQEISGLEDMEGPEPMELGSALEELTVVFTRNEDDEWDAAFDEGEDGDADLLEELENNTDLTFLLPGEEVEAGESWELEAEAFRRLLNLSGDLSIKPVDGDEEPDDGLEREWDVEEFTAELEELSDDTATIALKVEASRSRSGEMPPPELPEGFEGEPPTITLDETLTWELEGKLVWNVAAARAESLRLEGSLSREMERHQDMEGPMGSVSIVHLQVFEGDYEITITLEAMEGKEGE